MIAAHFGISRKTLSSRLAEKHTALSKAYYEGFAEAREIIMNKMFEKATEGKGDTVLLIFMGKALCGMTEKPDLTGDVADKAQAIRETVDKMNSGLTEFLDKDGNFRDPEAATAAAKKKKASASAKKRSKKSAVSSPPPIKKKKKLRPVSSRSL